MSRRTQPTVVNRALLYHGSWLVVGVCTAVPALLSIRAGEFGIGTLLMAVGGVGLVLGVGYERRFRDAPDPELPAGVLFALVFAAALTLVGTVLSALA